jgi:hypothetical protein
MRKLLNKEMDLNLAVAIYIVIIVFGTIIFSLASCVTPAKYQDWARHHPAESSRICSDLYPVQGGYRVGEDSITYLPINVTVPGGMVGLYLSKSATDTAGRRQDGNLTLSWQRTDSGYNITCRADSLQLVLDSLREIHRRVDTQLLVDNAHVRALQGDSGRLAQQLGKATTRGDNLLKWVWYLAGAALVLLGWTFRSPILGLFKKLIA